MNKKPLDPMNPDFWKALPMEQLKELLNRGLLIPTAKPGVYYVIKEITLPNMPEGSLPI
ncbi:MAG: hypothetical protein AAB307_00290 [Deltaproteobacteria bacterium]